MTIIRRLAVAAAACGASTAVEAQREEVGQYVRPAITRVVVAEGLRHPWSLAFLPGGELLVTEKDGGLVRVTAEGGLRRIGGIPPDLDNVRQDPRDNSGLFDVVLHPRFRETRQLYLSYASRGEGGTTTRLVRATLDGDRLTGLRTLFDALPRSSERFHYGGGLLIGMDGGLYLSVGERYFAETGQQENPVAQDPADPRGKIHRFDLDGTYRGIVALGIRATQGLALQPGTGRIWFSDHGPVGGDEINILVLGANYGWPVKTHGRFRDAAFRPVAPAGPITAPAFWWADRTVAPTGLTFYTGPAFPEWEGDLLVAGLSRGFLIRLDIENDRVLAVEYLLEDVPVRLRNVKQSPSGELFILTDEPNGKVIRLDRSRAGAR